MASESAANAGSPPDGVPRSMGAKERPRTSIALKGILGLGGVVEGDRILPPFCWRPTEEKITEFVHES